MDAEQNGNNVETQQLDPQPVLSIRATIQIADLGEEMGNRIPALLDYMKQNGAQPAGPPFVRYHTFGDNETDFEIGIPVMATIPGAGRIAAGELPGGPAITTWHIGPHIKLGEAYTRINDFIKEQGREPEGPAREVYYWIDPIQNFDTSTWDPSTGRTQLIQPIK